MLNAALEIQRTSKSAQREHSERVMNESYCSRYAWSTSTMQAFCPGLRQGELVMTYRSQLSQKAGTFANVRECGFGHGQSMGDSTYRPANRARIFYRRGPVLTMLFPHVLQLSCRHSAGVRAPVGSPHGIGRGTSCFCPSALFCLHIVPQCNLQYRSSELLNLFRVVTV